MQAAGPGWAPVDRSRVEQAALGINVSLSQSSLTPEHLYTEDMANA